MAIARSGPPPKTTPMTWETRKPLSPFWNSCIIEARLNRDPLMRPMKTRNGELAAWTWLSFRAIYQHENNNHRPHVPVSEKRPNYPIMGDLILMKVYAFGATGQILMTFNEGDWVRLEGFLTGNRLKNGKPVICLLAKRVTLLARRWKSKQGTWAAIRRQPLLAMQRDRAEERQRLIAKGLIKPSMGDLATIPDDVPEVDENSLDLDID